MPLTVILISTIITVLLAGGLWRPIVAVLGYLAVYILYNPDIWWGAMIAQYLSRPSLVAVLFIVAGSLLHANQLNWSLTKREIALYFFFAAVCLSSLVFGISMGSNNWVYMEKMLKVFIFIFFFIRVVNSPQHYRMVIWALALGGVFLAYQAHTLGPGHFAGSRLESLGGIDFREANGFAAFLAGSIVFLGVQLLRARWWQRVLYIAGIAVMMNAVVMTQSRAAFLGFALAAPYALIRAPGESRKLIGACVALGGILLFLLSDTKFLDRMDTIETAIKTRSEYTGEAALSRLDFWRASVAMFKDHPMGVGIKNFERLVPYYDPRNTGMDAHNTYVLCYSEIGIMGIILFLLIVAGGWFQLERIRKRAVGREGAQEIELHAFALELVFIIYFLGYLTTHSMLYNEIVWILLSMPICLERAASLSSAPSGTAAEAKGAPTA